MRINSIPKIARPYWVVRADYYSAKIIVKEPKKKKRKGKIKKRGKKRENSRNFSKEADSIVVRGVRGLGWAGFENL